jgi:hypothetical protein
MGLGSGILDEIRKKPIPDPGVKKAWFRIRIRNTDTERSGKLTQWRGRSPWAEWSGCIASTAPPPSERRCCQTGTPATSSAVYSTSESTDQIFKTQLWEGLHLKYCSFWMFRIWMGSGNKKAKMTSQKRRKRSKFTVWSAGYSLWKAWGFSCSFKVVHGGPRINILQVDLKKNAVFLP